MTKLTPQQVAVVREAQAEIQRRTQDMKRSGIDVYFAIDRGTKTVVCIRKYQHVHTMQNSQIGVARCSTEDRFVAPIGQIIALCRASGKKIPKQYIHIGC